MPIKNIINNNQKTIYSACRGVMSLEDFMEYLERIWGDTRYYGFNELFDTTRADWTEFDFGNLFVVAKNVARLTTMDPDSKLAWVVLDGKQKALTVFYENIKAMMLVNSREFKAFCSDVEALEWLKT